MLSHCTIADFASESYRCGFSLNQQYRGTMPNNLHHTNFAANKFVLEFWYTLYCKRLRLAASRSIQSMTIAKLQQSTQDTVLQIDNQSFLQTCTKFIRNCWMMLIVNNLKIFNVDLLDESIKSF